MIDQEPLRRNAGAECKKAMVRLEKGRTEWNRFEREDQPAFGRWRAREFGSLLSALREVEEQIREKEMLIHEVEAEMQFGARTRRAAYRRVIYERTHPAAARDDFDDPGIHQDDPSGRMDDLSDFEKEAIFQDWLREFLGVHPDKMDDRAYWSTFEAFRFHVFGQAEERPPQAGRTAEARPNGTDEMLESRLKKLYRLLVRQLHPDLRADGDPAVSSLWHEVQEAYAARNLGRLETLLALSDIESGQLGAQTTLFQMRAVVQELKIALRNLQRSLRAARDDDAWDFARQGGSRALRLRLEQDLENELATRDDKLNRLTNVIAGWSNPSPNVRRRKPPLDHPSFAF